MLFKNFCLNTSKLVKYIYIYIAKYQKKELRRVESFAFGRLKKKKK